MKYAFIALVAYLIGSNFWAYPTQDGISFGLGDFGYFYQYETTIKESF
jgi:hypothetical protein